MALLRPSELARLWQVNPKTVYVWIREGKLPAIRTPGAQYRVRTDDARSYADKNGLTALPLALTSPGGTVAVIAKPGPGLRALIKACKARGTALVTWPSMLEGLLGVASEAPDVLAIDARCEDVKLADALRALKKTKPTKNLAVVVFDASNKPRPALAKLGALVRGDGDEAAEAVLELLEHRVPLRRR
jgi:excisionase family DNA binding protein